MVIGRITGGYFLFNDRYLAFFFPSYIFLLASGLEGAGRLVGRFVGLFSRGPNLAQYSSTVVAVLLTVSVILIESPIPDVYTAPPIADYEGPCRLIQSLWKNGDRLVVNGLYDVERRYELYCHNDISAEFYNRDEELRSGNGKIWFYSAEAGLRLARLQSGILNKTLYDSFLLVPFNKVVVMVGNSDGSALSVADQIEILETAMRHTPVNNYYASRLSQLYWEAGKSELSLQMVNKVDRLMLKRGLLYRALGLFTQQELDWESDTLWVKSQIELKQGNIASAEKTMRLGVSRNVHTVKIPVELAQLFKQNNRVEEAQEYIDLASSRSAENMTYLLEQAQQAEKEGDPSERYHFLQLAVEQAPDNVQTWTELGDVAVIFNEIEKAVFNYRHALSLDSDNAQARLGLAKIELNQGNTSLAKQELNKLLEDKEINDRSLIEEIVVVYAQLLRETSLLTEAITFIEQYVGRYPDSVRLRKELVELHLVYGEANPALASAEYTVAMEIVEQIESIEPDTKENLLLKSRVALLAGEDKVAQQNYEKALSLYPFDLDITKQYADFLGKGNDWEKGITLLRQQIERFPEQSDLVIQMAGIYRQNKNYTAAVETVMPLLEADPHHPWLNYYIAETVMLADQSAEAIPYLQEVAGQTSKYQLDATVQLAKIFNDQGNCEKAIEYRIKSVELSKEQADRQLELADSYLICQNAEKALVIYKKLLQSLGEKPFLYFKLGQSYQALQKNELAIQQFQKLLEMLEPKTNSEWWMYNQSKQSLKELTKK